MRPKRLSTKPAIQKREWRNQRYQNGARRSMHDRILGLCLNHIVLTDA